MEGLIESLVLKVINPVGAAASANAAAAAAKSQSNVFAVKDVYRSRMSSV